MLLKNTAAGYGVVTKAFHWLSGVIVIGLLGVGLIMGDVKDLPLKLNLYGLHKSFGICVLALVTLRILWHIYSKKPRFVESLKDWEKKSARIVHYFLYFAMIGMPLSGWLFSSAKGRPVKVFGLGPLPDLIGEDKDLGKTLAEFHGYLGYVLIGAVCLHAAGAIKHHFFDHDKTLRRMLPF